MRKKYFYLLVAITFSIGLIAGTVFYNLISSQPFGLIFDLSPYLSVGAFALAFLGFTVLCFKSSKLWLKAIGSLLSIVTLLTFLLFVIICIDFRILFFQGFPPSLSKEEWKNDLHFLVEKMEKNYPDLYSKVQEGVYKETIKDIESKIPKLSENEIVMELFSIVALPNDGHTIPMLFHPIFNLHDFPIKIYKFEEGWYIIDAASKYRSLIGTRIIKVGSFPIDDLIKKFQTFLSAENEYGRLERFTRYGLTAEWLKSKGVIDNLNHAAFTIEKSNGEEVVLKIDAVKSIYKFLWTYYIPVHNFENQAFFNLRKDWYWFDILPNSKTLYFQITQIINQDGRETIPQFSKRLNDFVDTHEFDRFIVDLRNNIGGNGIELINLMNVIRDNKKINQRGKLFVLIGRETFSAGVLFAYKLKLQTNAILIGEPTSQGPVFGGNTREVELPNSKLCFLISSKLTSDFQTKWDFSIPDAVYPDVQVKYTYNDFKNGFDAGIDKALNYQLLERKSITLPKSIINKYIGRYLLDSLKVADITFKDSTFSICIDDFIPGNLFRIQSTLYARNIEDFETDISGVTLSFPKNSKGTKSIAILSWDGQKKQLERVPDSYILDFELLAQKKIDEASIKILSRKKYYSQIDMIEDKLNLIGYEYLQKKDIQNAIKIFELVVQLFPKSANAFDSLAEAYMNAGNKELAIENYEKSLELNPQNTNAVKQLEKLKLLNN